MTESSNINVLAIILARLDSTRLPGKALRIVNGRPLISYAIERVRKVHGLSSVVLATTDRPVDNPLVDFALLENISIYRGDAGNVAKRCIDCARYYGANYFLRVNADSPFVDPVLVEEGLGKIRQNKPDLVTNLLNRSYPYGVSVELVSVEKLSLYVPKLTADQEEHVTKIFYDNYFEFDILELSKSSLSFQGVKMVVDDEEDLSRFIRVVSNLGEATLSAGYAQVANAYVKF